MRVSQAEKDKSHLRILDSAARLIRERGVEGSVQVKMLVQKDGSVGDVKILDARPKGVFDQAVYSALAQWRFNPGKIAGKAVMAWVVTTIHFDLN